MSRYPCYHPGCPATYTTRAYRNKHAARRHVPCTCGRHFTETGLAAHVGQTKRHGIEHPPFPGGGPGVEPLPPRAVTRERRLTVRQAIEILIREAASAVAGAGQGLREPVTERRRTRTARAVARVWDSAFKIEPDATAFANLGLPFPDDAPEVTR